jgi:hypothetical protein
LSGIFIVERLSQSFSAAIESCSQQSKIERTEKMTWKIPLILWLAAFVSVPSFAQEIPLVYDVEHTGADFPKPILPVFEKLPIVRPLTDPFQWSDGNGRSTDFADWSRRRAEIRVEIEHYGIGEKPPRPKDITVVLENPKSISGGDVLNGFVLELKHIF